MALGLRVTAGLLAAVCSCGADVSRGIVGEGTVWLCSVQPGMGVECGRAVFPYGARDFVEQLLKRGCGSVIDNPTCVLYLLSQGLKS